MEKYILIGILVGLIAETIASYLKLWFYRHEIFRISNVTLVFGVLCGLLTYRAVTSGSLIDAIFAMGIFGLCYELVNLYAAHAWHFPASRFPWFKGRVAVIATTAAWASVPAIIYFLATSLQRLFGWS